MKHSIAVAVVTVATLGILAAPSSWAAGMTTSNSHPANTGQLPAGIPKPPIMPGPVRPPVALPLPTDTIAPPAAAPRPVDSIARPAAGIGNPIRK